MRIAFLLVVLAGLTACKPPPADTLQGYVEGMFRFVGSEIGGVVAGLDIARGDAVKPGQTLLRLDDTDERTGLMRANAELATAKANLADLSKGARQEEIDILRAQRASLEASAAYDKSRRDRRAALLAGDFASRERFEEADSTLTRDLAQIREIDARLALAELPARNDRIAAAKSMVAAAEAAAKEAEWRLSQTIVTAPVAGLVHDTLFDVGEIIPAGQPTVTLLVPEDIRIRFFVPETRLPELAIGTSVAIACDGCPDKLSARIFFIADVAEFTPPVIYSRSRREKFVYLVEAAPEGDPLRLKPGQPVDVTLP
ncbi:MAG: HlyD family efflux transporter periplasmic adaptor subunit [Pseudomonadota bacterium]|nr:HlyD family efflux transporter periplasmic adaptor subunit [Pseudomonadota bacterium]